MDGFKVTCLKCGNEVVIDAANGFYGEIMICPSSYDGDISISCEKCEYMVETGEYNK